MSETSLRITEIFHSLQGETSTTGLPTVFVRLTGRVKVPDCTLIPDTTKGVDSY
jgi:hypothetical protein